MYNISNTTPAPQWPRSSTAGGFVVLWYVGYQLAYIVLLHLPYDIISGDTTGHSSPRGVYSRSGISVYAFLPDRSVNPRWECIFEMLRSGIRNHFEIWRNGFAEAVLVFAFMKRGARQNIAYDWNPPNFGSVSAEYRFSWPLSEVFFQNSLFD